MIYIIFIIIKGTDGCEHDLSYDSFGPNTKLPEFF